MKHSKLGSGQRRPVTSHQEATGLVSLEVQSSPIQLATRSLSARAVTSVAGHSTDSDSAQRSTHSSRSTTSLRKVAKSSVPRQKGQASGRGVESSRKRVESSRKRVESSRKRTESSRKRAVSSRKGVESLRKGVETSKKGVEPVELPVSERGFNIAEHLRNSKDNDQLQRSPSSDVQKILQDISSVMRSVSPSLQPSLGDGEEKMAKLADRKAHLRSKMAANFILPVDEQEVGPEGRPSPHPMEDGVELERKPRRISRRTGQVPSLNIGDTHDLSNNSPQNGMASAQVSIPSVELEGGHSGESKKPTQGSNGRQGSGDVREHTPGGLSMAPGGHPLVGISTALAPAHAESHSAGRSTPVVASQSVELFGEERVGKSLEKVTSPAITEEGAGPEQTDEIQGGGELSRKASSQAMEVRSLLEEKRAGLSRSRLEELERAQSEVEARERKRAEREQRRAAKMKADRLAAIAELRKKREEKRLLQERIVQEEMVRGKGRVTG